MRKAWVLIAASALATITASGVADAGDRAAADALFREGRTAADGGDFATAHAKFGASQRLDPALGTLLNIADCEEHLGRLVDALGRYRGVLEKLPASDDRTAFVKERVADLEKNIPRLTLGLEPSAPQGTRVLLDGEDASARLGTETPVDPGPHVVVVDVVGREPKRLEIVVRKGEHRRFWLEPTAAPAPVEVPRSPPTPSARSLPPAAAPAPRPALASPSHEEPASPRSGFVTAGIATGALGVVGLAIGAVTGVMVMGKKDLVASHCDSTKACDQIGLDAGASGKTLSSVSTATFVLGAAALAGGVTLVVLGRGGSSPTTIQPTATVSGGAVAVSQAF